MHHIIYKVTSKSGKFYIGRHSTSNLDDGYCGSGKWVRQIKNKSEELTKVILEECSSFEELKEREEFYIEQFIDDDLCMNFNSSSCGFSTGKLNPSNREDIKKKSSERFKKDNPTSRPEVRLKVSQALMGRPSPNKGKKMSEEMKAKLRKPKTKKLSQEDRDKKAVISKRVYDEGNKENLTFRGHHHTDETKAKIAERFKNKPKHTCEYCGKEMYISLNFTSRD